MSSLHCFSFHIIQLNGEKSPEDLRESKATRWKRPGALNYYVDQNYHMTNIGLHVNRNKLIVQVAAWLSASPSHHLSWLCHLILILNSYASSVLHFSSSYLSNMCYCFTLFSVKNKKKNKNKPYSYSE